MSQSSKTMEQHGSKLDDQNESKEEHKYQTDRFQLQIFFGYVHLQEKTYIFVVIAKLKI